MLFLNVYDKARDDVTTCGNGRLFVLVGPAGVGKNTIMQNVIQAIDGLHQLPTMTTRAPRAGETEGVQHYFVSLDKFQAMIANNELLEHQEVHPGKFYGVPYGPTRLALENSDFLIADVDVLGAKVLKKAFPSNVITIFICPPSLAVLRQRMLARGNISDQELEERFQRATFELSLAEMFDHRIINDSLEATAERVTHLIQDCVQQAKAVSPRL